MALGKVRQQGYWKLIGFDKKDLVTLKTRDKFTKKVVNVTSWKFYCQSFFRKFREINVDKSKQSKYKFKYRQN